jgi:ferritin-like protein
MATSAEWHEKYDQMTDDSRNFSRAIKSIQEELEAVDWYNQRAEATTDKQLKKILEHNRDEEIEHAMMALEWLRRTNAKFDEHMRTYLFTEGDILEIEEKAEKE